jgi:hypothetical protein
MRMFRLEDDNEALPVSVEPYGLSEATVRRD